jgi:hypothetical protein
VEVQLAHLFESSCSELQVLRTVWPALFHDLRDVLVAKEVELGPRCVRVAQTVHTSAAVAVCMAIEHVVAPRNV